jgi:hypothetical protein
MKEIKKVYQTKANENKVVFTRITADQSNEKYGLKFSLIALSTVAKNRFPK